MDLNNANLTLRDSNIMLLMALIGPEKVERLCALTDEQLSLLNIEVMTYIRKECREHTAH